MERGAGISLLCNKQTTQQLFVFSVRKYNLKSLEQRVEARHHWGGFISLRTGPGLVEIDHNVAGHCHPGDLIADSDPASQSSDHALRNNRRFSRCNSSETAEETHLNVRSQDVVVDIRGNDFEYFLCPPSPLSAHYLKVVVFSLKMETRNKKTE